MLYSVSIDPTLLGDDAPADGFIDPTTVEYHRSRLTYTGTATSPTMTKNNQIYVRDVPVTISGTSLTDLVADINAKSFYHNVFAVDATNKLQLSMLPGFENLIPTITDITGNTVVTVGFINPVISAVPANTTTLAASLAKERGNVRWELILEALQLTSNISYKVTSIAGANVTTAPTSVDFVLEVPDGYYNYDLSGEKVFGILAIKNAIAKTLMYSVKKMRDFYDPTDTSPASNRPLSQVVREITVGQLTSTSSTALGAVSVETII